MRFAKWTAIAGWHFLYKEKDVWWTIKENELFAKTTEELYNSQAFLDYLKQFEK